MPSGCENDDDCTGDRWCDPDRKFCTGKVTICDAHHFVRDFSHPDIPEAPSTWAQSVPVRLAHTVLPIEGMEWLCHRCPNVLANGLPDNELL